MKKQLLALLILSLILREGSASLVQAQSTSPAVIGGFDQTQAGNASFPLGSSFSQARTAILSNYPATVFAGFRTLAASNLAGVAILIIGTPTTISNAISPLTADEQGALLGFVKGGGAAVLFTDNDSFAPLASAANTSLLAPFGMGGIGTMGGQVTVVVPAPLQHPLTSGPFEIISSFTEFAPGGIGPLGPYALSLAVNYVGTALAVINPGALVAGSGPVVAFSDISGFWDTDGYFPGNAALFLNVIDYCRNAPRGWRLNINQVGTEVVLDWPAAASNMVLEATTSLAAGSTWTQVTNVPAAIGTEDFVTNQMVGAEYYRLATDK